MSWLSKGLKKLEKNVTRPIAKEAKRAGKKVGKVAAKGGALLGPMGAPIQLAGRMLEGQSFRDAVKRTGVSTGRYLDKTAAGAQFVPGAGPLLQGGLKLAAAGLQGKSMKPALIDAAMSAVGSKFGGQMIDKVAGKIPGGATAAKFARSSGILPPPPTGGTPGGDYIGHGLTDAIFNGGPGTAASGGKAMNPIAGAIRGALGGKPITIGNVTSAITGGDGGFGDVVGLLGSLGVTAAGLKAGHDATKRAHELNRRQMAVGDDLASFGRASLASASAFRDAAQGPLLMRLMAGPTPATDFSRFADTRNPFRARYGGMPLLPPPGGMR